MEKAFSWKYNSIGKVKPMRKVICEFTHDGNKVSSYSLLLSIKDDPRAKIEHVLHQAYNVEMSSSLDLTYR